MLGTQSLREVVVGEGSVLRIAESPPQLRDFGSGTLDDLDQVAGLRVVHFRHFVHFAMISLIHGAHLALAYGVVLPQSLVQLMIACRVVRRQNILHFAIPRRVLRLQCLAQLAA